MEHSTDYLQEVESATPTEGNPQPSHPCSYRAWSSTLGYWQKGTGFPGSSSKSKWVTASPASTPSRRRQTLTGGDVLSCSSRACRGQLLRSLSLAPQVLPHYILSHIVQLPEYLSTTSTLMYYSTTYSSLRVRPSVYVYGYSTLNEKAIPLLHAHESGIIRFGTRHMA